MKNKKMWVLVFFLLILILPVQATVQTLIVRQITGVISGGSSELAKLTQLAMGAPPQELLVGEITKRFPEPMMRAYHATTNPSSVILSDIQNTAFNTLPKELQNAIAKFKKYEGIVNEISEEERPIIEIKEDGQTFFIDSKTKQTLVILGTNSAWDISDIDKKTGQFTLTRKKENLKDYALKCKEIKKVENCDPLIVRGAEINFGNEGGKIDFNFNKQDGESIINIQEGSADIGVGDTLFENVGRGEIRTFVNSKGDSELRYANFIAGPPDKLKKSTSKIY